MAPKALAPQIAMNSASLSTYKTLREFIVQYLKSKNLWRRSAGTTFGSASASSAPYSGPAPMEIGAVDVADAKPHKGKEAKGGKGGKKGNPDKGSRGSPAEARSSHSPHSSSGTAGRGSSEFAAPSADPWQGLSWQQGPSWQQASCSPPPHASAHFPGGFSVDLFWPST